MKFLGFLNFADEYIWPSGVTDEKIKFLTGPESYQSSWNTCLYLGSFFLDIIFFLHDCDKFN